jgi:hypothetical protein
LPKKALPSGRRYTVIDPDRRNAGLSLTEKELHRFPTVPDWRTRNDDGYAEGWNCGIPAATSDSDPHVWRLFYRPTRVFVNNPTIR